MKNELYHHGIDGQRWGVTHGPPYPLSRAKHRAVVKSQEASEKRNISYRKSRKFAKRMSDEDLNATIDRLKREETYRQLVSKDKMAKAQKKEIKKQTKAIEKAQKKQEQQKSKNQNDGTIKKSVKEAIGGGIKTMGNAGFQALAKMVFPETSSPKIEYTKTKDGWLAKVVGGTEDDVRKTETFLSSLLNKSVSDIDTSTKTTVKTAAKSTAKTDTKKSDLFDSIKQPDSSSIYPENKTPLNAFLDIDNSWYNKPVSDLDDFLDVFSKDYEA